LLREKRVEASRYIRRQTVRLKATTTRDMVSTAAASSANRAPSAAWLMAAPSPKAVRVAPC
jgi:hypothetical protein